MPMFRTFLLPTFLRPALLLALCLSAMAPASLPAEEPRMYRVEMVLFRHTDRQAITSEVWHSGPVSRLQEAVRVDEPDGARGFRDVSRTPFGLRGLVTRLNAAPLYEVIASYAWEQPGLPAETAIPVRIQAGPLLGRESPQDRPEFTPWQITPIASQPPEAPQPPAPIYEVDGTVTLSLARFLHLHTELLYRRATDEPLGGDHVWTLEGGQFAESLVSERRRMRSREVHYLDHPMMGVIVEVTPVE